MAGKFRKRFGGKIFGKVLAGNFSEKIQFNENFDRFKSDHLTSSFSTFKDKKNSNVIPLKRVLFYKTLENKKVFFHLSRIFAFLGIFVILIVKSFVNIINKGLSTDQLTFVNFCCSYE